MKLAPSTDFDGKSASCEQRILMVGACQMPGPVLAAELVARGARVVALDTDSSALRALAKNCSGRIEPLTMPALDAATFERLGSAWGHAPLHVAVNLMPLSGPRDINGALRGVANLMRATTRGLIAGQGALINVVSVPDEMLDLPATAMSGAFEAAHGVLNKAVQKRGLRLHLVVVSQSAPENAVSALRFLSGPSARGMAAQTLRVG